MKKILALVVLAFVSTLLIRTVLFTPAAIETEEAVSGKL
jgi:hypothetical protein